jgi:hypothetical protein
MEWTNEKWYGTIVVMEDKRKVVRYNSSLSSITTIVPYHFSFVHHIVCPSYYYYCTVPLFVCPPLLLLYRTTFRLSSITTIVPCHFSFVHYIVCPSYYYYCTVPLFVCHPLLLLNRTTFRFAVKFVFSKNHSFHALINRTNMSSIEETRMGLNIIYVINTLMRKLKGQSTMRRHGQHWTQGKQTKNTI